MKRAAWLAILLIAGWLAADTAPAELLGPLTRDDILAGLPDWQSVVDSYAPDLAALERLKDLDRPVQVEVFLGTWCPDSKRHVSEFFKVLDMAGTPFLVASYIGVPKQKETRAEYYGGKDIQKLPTFLVIVNGVEQGRIIEVPAKSVEQDLVDILFR